MDDIDGLIVQAKETGRKLNVYDVDAPLEMSLLGVLGRQPGGADPIPPFHVIGQEGFKGVRGNRLATVQKFIDDPSLGKYELVATDPSGKKVKAATVEDGKLTVHNEHLFKQSTTVSDSDITAIAQKPITIELIQELTAPLPKAFAEQVRKDLAEYMGHTWQEAIELHGKKPAPDANK